MKIGRRTMTKLLAGVVPAAWMSRASAWQKPRSIAPGPFEPTWDSLKQYQAPDWFRDAKFGIWAHWTAQCVPEQGDWYRSEEHTSELQSLRHLVCRLLLEKKKK